MTVKHLLELLEKANPAALIAIEKKNGKTQLVKCAQFGGTENFHFSGEIPQALRKQAKAARQAEVPDGTSAPEVFTLVPIRKDDTYDSVIQWYGSDDYDDPQTYARRDNPREIVMALRYVDNPEEIAEFLDGGLEEGPPETSGILRFKRPCRTNKARVWAGEWIVKDKTGACVVLPDAEFTKSYRHIEQEVPDEPIYDEAKTPAPDNNGCKKYPEYAEQVSGFWVPTCYAAHYEGGEWGQLRDLCGLLQPPRDPVCGEWVVRYPERIEIFSNDEFRVLFKLWIVAPPVQVDEHLEAIRTSRQVHLKSTRPSVEMGVEHAQWYHGSDVMAVVFVGDDSVTHTPVLWYVRATYGSDEHTAPSHVHWSRLVNTQAEGVHVFVHLETGLLATAVQWNSRFLNAEARAMTIREFTATSVVDWHPEIANGLRAHYEVRSKGGSIYIPEGGWVAFQDGKYTAYTAEVFNRHFRKVGNGWLE